MTKPLDSGTKEAQRKQIKTSKKEDQRHQSRSETCRNQEPRESLARRESENGGEEEYDMEESETEWME